MSRIGKKAILIPEGVEIKIEGQKVFVKGPKGELSLETRPEIGVETKEGKIFITPKVETKQTGVLWGTTRALVFNMVEGVSRGFEKKLEIQGIGFKAAVEGNEIVLSVGFSHPVKIKIPQNLKISIEKNIITVSGNNKELVGQFSGLIRKAKQPEPYKGKGIRYLEEQIRRKVGKKVSTTTT